MSSTNGLMGAAAFRKVGVPYYLDNTPEVTLTEPILVAPITIKSSDLEAQGTLSCRGFTGGLPAPYTGAIKLIPGSSSVGAAAEGLTIRSVGGGTQVEVGTDAETPNVLAIAGASGLSQVYDEKYNPVINGTAVAAVAGALPGTLATRTFVYTPDKTGAYMLQVNVNIRNADSIPLDGFLEWVLSAAGSEVQFASNTLNSNALIKVLGMDEINGAPGGTAEPTDFTTSDLCFLTAGVPVTFSIITARNSTVGGLSWAIQNYDARLIQMC